mmetsp:Transcript_32569/g.50689  ORF Transcript_32569/g.50689 Transcript_32569/m.50689 type:complete len:516 (-) Transcript_32569:713-2260(-)
MTPGSAANKDPNLHFSKVFGRQLRRRILRAEKQIMPHVYQTSNSRTAKQISHERAEVQQNMGDFLTLTRPVSIDHTGCLTPPSVPQPYDGCLSKNSSVASQVELEPQGLDHQPVNISAPQSNPSAPQHPGTQAPEHFSRSASQPLNPAASHSLHSSALQPFNSTASHPIHSAATEAVASQSYSTSAPQHLNFQPPQAHNTQQSQHCMPVLPHEESGSQGFGLQVSNVFGVPGGQGAEGLGREGPQGLGYHEPQGFGSQGAQGFGGQGPQGQDVQHLGGQGVQHLSGQGVQHLSGQGFQGLCMEPLGFAIGSQGTQAQGLESAGFNIGGQGAQGLASAEGFRAEEQEDAINGYRSMVSQQTGFGVQDMSGNQATQKPEARSSNMLASDQAKIGSILRELSSAHPQPSPVAQSEMYTPGRNPHHQTTGYPVPGNACAQSAPSNRPDTDGHPYVAPSLAILPDWQLNFGLGTSFKIPGELQKNVDQGTNPNAWAPPNTFSAPVKPVLKVILQSLNHGT